jgi:IS5 family transposase
VQRSFADRGYREHGIEDAEVHISARKRGMTPQMKKELKRRGAIKPFIGHMKTDGKLGDKINALLFGAGHNIRVILKKLRECCSFSGLSSQLNHT